MQTALITGGSSGIGLEYAGQLARRGCGLLLVSNQEEQLREVAERLQADYGVPVKALYMDLAKEGCAQELVDYCDKEGLAVDILINNAGMFFIDYLGGKNLGKARAMMKLHVQTVTECCILFGEKMKQRGQGKILIMSSMTARIPAPGIAIYSASKAYLKSFGKSLSYEMKPYGVTVTTVCPAAVDTGLYKLSDKMRKAGRCLGLVQRPETLVNRALRALDRGRRTYSPGIMNVLLPPLVKLLPARLIDRLGLKWMQ